MWLLITLLANSILAAVGILDKFILTKSVPKPVVLVFYSTIFVLPLFLLLPFGLVVIPSGVFEYLIFIVSGISFAFGLWAMYGAVGKSEVSRVGPLVGAATPFFILFLGKFLGEQLGLYAFVGAVFLIIGSLIIALGSKIAKNWQAGLGLAILSGLLFGISHVSAKYIYGSYDFFTGFVFTKLPLGLFGLLLLFSPAVRGIFYQKTKSTTAKISGKNQLLLVGGNMILGVAGTVLLQYATYLGSVTLVNAMAGIQYALLVVFSGLISKFFPTIIKEEFSKQAIVYKSGAVLSIAIGLVLILIT